MPAQIQPKHVLPNLITTVSVVLGFLVVVESAAGHFGRAVLMVFAAGICDLLDGRLARWLDAGTAFGGELDSLADAIAFGVAPAVMAWFAFLRPLGMPGLIVALVYLLAGVFRLARFNLDKGKKSTFYGIPIPVAAGYIVSFVLLRDEVSPWWLAFGVLCTAATMISTIKVPNFKDRDRTLPMWLLPVPIVLFAVFIARPGVMVWHAWNLFNCVLVAMNYRMFARSAPELKAVARDRAA